MTTRSPPVLRPRRLPAHLRPDEGQRSKQRGRGSSGPTLPSAWSPWALLEGAHCGLGGFVVAAVERPGAGVQAGGPEPALQFEYGGATGTGRREGRPSTSLSEAKAGRAASPAMAARVAAPHDTVVAQPLLALEGPHRGIGAAPNTPSRAATRYPRTRRKPCSWRTPSPVLPSRSAGPSARTASSGAGRWRAQVSPLYARSSAGVRVHLDPAGGVQLEVEVGSRAFGVAAVAHPADQLPRRHPGPGDDAVGDAPAESVVRARGVVVEVDVPGLPAVVVEEEDRAAVGPEPGDGGVGRGVHRRHLRGQDVDPLVTAGAPIATGPEPQQVVVGEVDVGAADGEGEGVLHRLPVGEAGRSSTSSAVGGGSGPTGPPSRPG